MHKRKRSESSIPPENVRRATTVARSDVPRGSTDPDFPLPSIERSERSNTVASAFRGLQYASPRYTRPQFAGYQYPTAESVKSSAGSQYQAAPYPGAPRGGLMSAKLANAEAEEAIEISSGDEDHAAACNEETAATEDEVKAATDDEEEDATDDEENDVADDDQTETDAYYSRNNKAITAGIKAIKKGKNIFVTGPAGSGKSHFISQLVTHLRDSEKNKKPKKVEIIAPTGTAALNVGGRTCHAFFSLTPNTVKRPIEQVLEVAEQESVKQKLQDVDVLVIDEISMISNEFLQQMDRLMRTAREEDEKPFGGVTVCAVGDFAQLAPVNGLSYCLECGEERAKLGRGAEWQCFTHGKVREEQKWAFNSPTWKALKFQNILLEHIMRQNTDQFREIVHSMWLGNKLNQAQLKLLREKRTLPPVTTHLYTRRLTASEHNAREFAKLTAPVARYVARDTFHLHSTHNHPWVTQLSLRVKDTGFLSILKDHRYSESLELKLGMPVILLQNICVEAGLVNGSQGKIVGFTTGDIMDHMHLAVTGSSDILGYNWQDTTGQVTQGVIQSLGGSYQARRDSEVREFILEPANRGQRWPVVKFNNGIERAIVADCSVHEVRFHGHSSLLMRTQIPLMAGWALTIHKAQGMTLDAVVVDLKGSFDPGQEYVAISRARTLDGLEIRGLQKNGLKFRTPEVVRDFMKNTFSKLRQRVH